MSSTTKSMAYSEYTTDTSSSLVFRDVRFVSSFVRLSYFGLRMFSVKDVWKLSFASYFKKLSVCLHFPYQLVFVPYVSICTISQLELLFAKALRCDFGAEWSLRNYFTHQIEPCFWGKKCEQRQFLSNIYFQLKFHFRPNQEHSTSVQPRGLKKKLSMLKKD